MAENDNFDTEEFIAAIHSRRAIWDMALDEYSNRNLKKKAWEEVTNLYVKEGDSIEAKNELGRTLQKKWKSLRDCYTRERQRLEKIKSGSAVSRKTQYVFFQQLSFLSGVVKPRSSTNNMDENPASTDEQSNSPDDGSMIEPPEPGTSGQSARRNVSAPKKRKVEKNPEELSHLVEVIRKSMESRQELEKSREEDDDRLFLLSLVNPLKRLPQHVRFSIRTQFSQIIENAARGSFAFGGGQQGPAFNPYFQSSESQRYQQNYLGPMQQVPVPNPVQQFQLPGNTNTLGPLPPNAIPGPSQRNLSPEQISPSSPLLSPASNTSQYSQDDFDIYS